MSTLFISHSSADNAAAGELMKRLEEQGHHSVFLDLDPEKGIQTGVSWERTLYTKLRACRAVVALCSKNYFASQWCFAEIALARMEGKEMFVLQIDPWGKNTKMPSILTEEQFIDLRTDQDDGYQRLWNGFKVKGIVPEEHREWGPEEPPYPGLRAFDEKDAPIFFGRDQEVREGVELLNRVRRQGHPRMVMVLGSSGSGKSSLARAGIVPRLRRDADSWRVVGPFRPGRRPHRELAAALSRAFDEAGGARSWEEIHGLLGAPAGAAAEHGTSPRSTGDAETSQLAARDRLREALRAMESDLSAEDTQVTQTIGRLRDLLERPPAKLAPGTGPAPATGDSALAELASELRLAGDSTEASVVLVIDQFEELLGHDDEGPNHPANHFLRLLRDGIESEDDPPLALGTMRSDFLGVLQRSAFLEGVGFKSLSVGPMPREGMRQVIEEPATLGQLELEAGLADRLLDETGTADALPLLAFTLRAMWDRYHDDRQLEIREYEDLGGLQGAIALVAEETMEAALELGDEQDLRDAFLSLARPAAEGTGWARQPASWEDLPDKVRPMLQHFVDQRLLVQQADGTVEVAHEALFRSWGKLRGWLNENSEALHLLREIRLDAEKWQQEETDENKEPYLWRAGRLARALELRESGMLPLQKLDHAFIADSDRAHRARIEAKEALARQELRRARALALAAVATLIVVGFLAIQAHLARRDAVRARDRAEGLIDYMLNDLREGLEKVGRLELLAGAAQESQIYFDSLTARDESPAALYKQGRTLLYLGDALQGKGDTEAARDAYASALALFAAEGLPADGPRPPAPEREPTRDPTISDWIAGRSLGQLHLGKALTSLGKREDALAALKEALREAQEVLKRHPENPEYRFAVAQAHLQIAGLELYRGKLQDSEKAGRAALEAAEKLVEGAEGIHWRHQLLLLDARAHLGAVSRNRSELDAALEMYQLARRQAEELVTEDPANAFWPRRLANIHYQIAFLFQWQNDLPAALGSFEAARDAYARLTITDQKRVRWQGRLAGALQAMGSLRSKLGEDGAAMALYEEARGLFERLSADDPKQVGWIEMQAAIHQSVARTQLRTGDTSAAVESYRAALEIRKRLVAAAGEDPRSKAELAWNHYLLGEVYERRQELELADRQWRQASEIIATVTAGSDVPSYWETHALALLRLGLLEEARPWVEKLLAKGWDKPDFLRLVRESGLKLEVAPSSAD